MRRDAPSTPTMGKTSSILSSGKRLEQKNPRATRDENFGPELDLPLFPSMSGSEWVKVVQSQKIMETLVPELRNIYLILYPEPTNSAACSRTESSRIYGSIVFWYRGLYLAEILA